MRKLTIYIAKHRPSTTHSAESKPCSHCTKEIKRLGIKKIVYVVIVIAAFTLGHHYGEDAAGLVKDVPLPKVTIEMPEKAEPTVVETQ